MISDADAWRLVKGFSDRVGAFDDNVGALVNSIISIQTEDSTQSRPIASIKVEELKSK